ncbi:MAG: hypothetical protein VYE22_39355 [Myxococcota bacterium]|nr:hypothetical protein [Myxococcota bacterium]
MRARGWVTAALLGSLALPGVAHAGNGDGILVGNEAAMTGGAVSAVVRDGSGTWYNPAGLASIDRGAVDVNGSALMVRAAEEGGLISSTTGEANDGGYLELLSIPSAATIARLLEPGVAIAFGIFAPRFGSHTTRTGLDADSGPNRARWTLSSSEFRATYHAGGALGLRISDQLRFGVSLFGVYRESSSSFQSSGAFELGDGRTRVRSQGGIVQVRSFGVELGLGVQWEPHPGVIIGLTGRSPGLELITQIRATETALDLTVSDGAPDMLDFRPEDAETLDPAFTVLTTGRFNLSFAHRFDRGWVAAELDVQLPRELEPLPRRRFVWNVRAGGRYEVDERLGIGAGFFTDLSEGEPIEGLGQTQVDFVGWTAGFEYRTPHTLGEEEDASTLVFSTTAALRYAIGWGQVGGLRFDPNNGTARETFPVGTTIHELGLHIGSALYF